MGDPRTHLFSNNASCLLGEDVDVGETSIQLASGKGALFPDPDTGEIFIFTIEDLVQGYREILYCTERDDDVLTVERAQEGTTAREWTQSNNVVVQHRVTAGTLEYLDSGTGTPCEFQLACSNLTSDISAGTSRGYFRAPFAFTITDVRASLLVAHESGTFTVDINVNEATILSTKLTIDAEEKTSETAVTPAVVSSAAVADDDEIVIDVDDAGAGARGLVVTIKGTRT